MATQVAHRCRYVHGQTDGKADDLTRGSLGDSPAPVIACRGSIGSAR